MIPKLRGSFVDRTQGFGEKYDLISSRISAEPRVTKIEKRDLA
jgi:hypothetical protein